MTNMPKVRLGLVAVSRDCFPIELSRKRQLRVAEECRKAGLAVTRIPTIVENETDALQALEEVRAKKINALVIYLGNFGPEGPTTILAQKFDGPVMVAAAAEESGNDLVNGRGDAYCGMLNNSYNMGLRKLRPYIPEYPVGTPEEVADDDRRVRARRPRPPRDEQAQDLFLRAATPGFSGLQRARSSPSTTSASRSWRTANSISTTSSARPRATRRSKAVAADMARELGAGNQYPDILAKLAQFEVALLKFMEKNLGASKYGVFANKCWPAFENFFGFVPCYVNSRLAARGIPVACEVDIYGALSEYICTCATELPATLLDINNTVPYDMIAGAKKATKGYKPTDLFMGFHCGNTPAPCMLDPAMRYQLIMHRLMEPGKDPDITRGTLEGRIKPGGVTIFRLQSTADTVLRSYMAEGEVLDVDPKSFGGIGVIGIKEMGRFYRHVLIEKRFPHHTAVAFDHAGRALWAAMRMLGLEDISFNRPAGMLYPTENPF